jgi:hypothetical protein
MFRNQKLGQGKKPAKPSQNTLTGLHVANNNPKKQALSMAEAGPKPRRSETRKTGSFPRTLLTRKSDWRRSRDVFGPAF